jgi:NAD(P)-dependent dehydrogenase (short-subunit alcohol dehydrogenase family)
MADRLKDKAALVFGAGSSGPGWGNGKAAAVAFAREGARVMAVDLNPRAAEETCAIIRSEGGIAEAIACDVTRTPDVQRAVQACLDAWGQIDVLHNNVGIAELGGAAETSEEQWDRILEVNLKGMFRTCKAVLPIMERQGKGAIVNVSSLAGIRYPGIPYIAYGVAKAGVNQLTVYIAVEFAAKGIRCNAILPGLIDTPMVRGQLMGHYGDPETLVRARDARSPTGRMGTPWDIAQTAVFLASDEAPYLTGQLFGVDGGLSWTN